MILKLQPVRILCLFLALLALGASVSWVGSDSLEYLVQVRNFALIYLSGFIVYFLGVQAGIMKTTRWEHRVISSLILFLLFDSFLPWWVFLSLGIITELLQRFVRSVAGPILNPASAGALMLAALGQYPSWWGVSFAPRINIIEGGISIAAFFTLPIAGYIVYKYKKLWIPTIAFVLYSVTYFLIFRSNPLFIILEGTVLFYLLIMAVEPKTSPILKNDQIIFGAVVGLLAPLLLKFGFYEANLGALLTANILWYLKRFKKTTPAITQVVQDKTVGKSSKNQ